MKIKIIRSFAVQQFSKVEFKDFELPKQKGRSEQPMRKRTKRKIEKLKLPKFNEKFRE